MRGFTGYLCLWIAILYSSVKKYYWYGIISSILVLITVLPCNHVGKSSHFCLCKLSIFPNLTFWYVVWITLKRYLHQKSFLLQFFLGHATIPNRLTRLEMSCNWVIVHEHHQIYQGFSKSGPRSLSIWPTRLCCFCNISRLAYILYCPTLAKGSKWPTI